MNAMWQRNSRNETRGFHVAVLPRVNLMRHTGTKISLLHINDQSKDIIDSEFNVWHK
jgi:hypothetical protein